MKANIFGSIAVLGLLLIGLGIALSPIWIKCIFFGIVIMFIGGMLLSEFCIEDEIIGKTKK